MARSIIRCSFVVALLMAAAPPAVAGEAGPIEVVQAAYVDGIHRNADVDAMMAGFHPDFIMFLNTDEGMKTLTRHEWATRVAKAGADPDREIHEIAAKLDIVGQSGKAAVVKVELERDGKHVYTDFLSLYETADGWKIIAKIYQRH
jgi:hypothetical protein